LDFKKVYDKIHYSFLMQCLRKRGFNDTWCKWIVQVLKNGTVAVKVNNSLGPYFVSYKGVRQGDPLSPLLFNIATDVLTRMVIEAQNGDVITGLISNLIPKGAAILQYADDIIMCLQHSMEKTVRVKLLLYIYEQMSGLKINFEKSEIILIMGDNELAVRYAELFNCQIGFPL
jgi:hypothetical protein